jgi:hypothetical protein
MHLSYIYGRENREENLPWFFLPLVSAKLLLLLLSDPIAGQI